MRGGQKLRGRESEKYAAWFHEPELDSSVAA
jgi:hypothetical protein